MYCLNPACPKPQLGGTGNFCPHCGFKLLLKERYQALKPLNQGGFGRTFLAVDQDHPHQQRCVIKQFLPQSGNRQKAAELFEREAQQLAALGAHPQIPTLLSYFTQDQQLYLVQEFIDGQNLGEVLTSHGTWSADQVRLLLESILPVLTFVHDHQIIHRDIKPDNIMLRSGGQTYMLVDFGASRQVDPRQPAKTGTVIGTADYAAPEQLRGKPVYASDLYALGVTCVHLLTGVQPFDLYSSLKDQWVWRDFLPAPVPPVLGQVLDRLLLAATEQRYQQAQEVLQALGRSSRPSSPAGNSSSSTLPKPPRPQGLFNRSPAWDLVGLLKTPNLSPVTALVFDQAGGQVWATTISGHLARWETASGQLTRWVRDPYNWQLRAISRIDDLVLAAGSGRKISIWNDQADVPIDNLAAHRGRVNSLVSNPDNHLLISGADDRSLHLWQVDSEIREHSTLLGEIGGITCVAAHSGYETAVAGGSYSGAIKVWQFSNGIFRSPKGFWGLLSSLFESKRVKLLRGHSMAVRSLAFSPTSNTTLFSAANDRTIKVWDLDSGRCKTTLRGHTKAVTCLAVSSPWLVSGSDDRTIKLWNLNTWVNTATLTGHTSYVQGVAFSPDGQRLASAGWDGTVRVYQVPTQNPD